MVNYQTTTQKVNSIRFGSAKIEVGEDVASLVNPGDSSKYRVYRRVYPYRFEAR